MSLCFCEYGFLSLKRLFDLNNKWIGECIMKRFIAFAAAIITAVSIAACSVTGKNDASKPNGLDTGFSADVSVQLDDLNASGNIKRIESGNWEIEFNSPNTLSGVKLAFNDGNVSASYKGLNFSVPQTALPVKAMMLNLISAVDDLAANEKLTGKEEDGMLKIDGTLDGGDYTLVTDNNGNLTSFEMPNNKLNMKFSGLVPIDLHENSTESTDTGITTLSSGSVSSENETETTASTTAE